MKDKFPLVSLVNMMVVREIASVTTAVAHGDLTKKVERPARGEILQLQQTINTMVDQLRTFASEVTRVARNVGTEGILGGQADVVGVQGMWNDLTVNVNAMADNLTTQVSFVELSPSTAELIRRLFSRSATSSR